MGKTAVLKSLLPLLDQSGESPCVCKIDCLQSKDAVTFQKMKYPCVTGLSGDICPDHFLVSNLPELWQWTDAMQRNLLVIETAGLCHRCSPATKHMLAGCVVDCTVSCKAPGQLGPMLTQADFVVLTKVDMISQAEMEIICWQIGQINPQAKIFPVDALAGYGIDLLAQWLLTQPRHMDFTEDTLRHTMPSGVCSYCVGELLPVASIPLTYFTHTPESCRTKRLTEQTSLAFGGINNSAVKTVVKYIWEAYGKQAAENILSSSLVTDMPIGAYQAVRQQQANTALCPSLYGLRADEKETFLYTPQEGAVLIPSYFCARKSLPEDVARYIANEILCQELCDFYVANGDLILYPACTTLHSKQETGLFACPSAKWLEALDPEEFLAMYTKHLPSAVNVF